MRLVPVVVLAVVVAACASVQPVPIRAGDTCYRCRDVIPDLKLAAELIDAKGHAFTFGCPGCMAAYLAGHPEERPMGLFVTDYPSGRLIHAESAVYVKFLSDPNRGREDYAAFRDSGEAAAFAAGQRGAGASDWHALMAEAAGS